MIDMPGTPLMGWFNYLDAKIDFIFHLHAISRTNLFSYGTPPLGAIRHATHGQIYSQWYAIYLAVLWNQCLMVPLKFESYDICEHILGLLPIDFGTRLMGKAINVMDHVVSNVMEFMASQYLTLCQFCTVPCELEWQAVECRDWKCEPCQQPAGLCWPCGRPIWISMRLYIYGSVAAERGCYDGFVLTLKLNSEDLPPFENSESASGRLHILEGGGGLNIHFSQTTCNVKEKVD